MYSIIFSLLLAIICKEENHLLQIEMATQLTCQVEIAIIVSLERQDKVLITKPDHKLNLNW